MPKLNPDNTPSVDHQARAPAARALDSNRTEDGLGLHTLAVSFTAHVDAAMADGAWALRAGGQRYSARLAFGCLVEPAVGDQVACWRAMEPLAGSGPAAQSPVFILSVLTRADSATPQRLRLAAQSELHAGHFNMHAQTVELNTGSASLVARTLHSVGELCKATWGQLRMVGASLSTSFDQQVHHARMHQRTVDGLDRVQAQVIEQQAEALMHLRAPNVLTEGDRLVKTRGAQIHFG